MQLFGRGVCLIIILAVIVDSKDQVDTYRIFCPIVGIICL
jgi:hypothetical protein